MVCGEHKTAIGQRSPGESLKKNFFKDCCERVPRGLVLGASEPIYDSTGGSGGLRRQGKRAGKINSPSTGDVRKGYKGPGKEPLEKDIRKNSQIRRTQRVISTGQRDRPSKRPLRWRKLLTSKGGGIVSWEGSVLWGSLEEK